MSYATHESPRMSHRAMRRMASACLALLWAAPATAAPDRATPAEPRVQFVDMEAMLIDGDTVKPRVMRLDAREKVKFDRLFELKRRVLPALRESGRDLALR